MRENMTACEDTFARECCGPPHDHTYIRHTHTHRANESSHYS